MEYVRLGVATGCGIALTLAVQQSKLSGSYFARHPMSAGWGLTLWASGLIIYRMRNRCTLQCTRWLHSGLMTAGAILLDYSVFVMYNVKEEKKKSHYKTWHGRVALIASITCTTQALGSWLLMYPSNRENIQKRKKYHRWIGYGILSLSTAALTMGWWKTEILGSEDIYRPLGLIGGLVLGGATLL